MDATNMLGKIMVKIVGLSLDRLGVLYDLAEKLASEAGREWLAELKKFLRREECWTKIKKIISYINFSKEDIFIIEPCDGSEGISDVDDVFDLVDPDFGGWDADERGQSSEKTVVHVGRLSMGGTFAQIFGSLFGASPSGIGIHTFIKKNSVELKKIFCLTPHQVKRFAQDNREWIRKKDVFIPYNAGGRFFVARMYYHHPKELKVAAYQIWSGSGVWRVGSRIVLPQLDI